MGPPAALFRPLPSSAVGLLPPLFVSASNMSTVKSNFLSSCLYIGEMIHSYHLLFLIIVAILFDLFIIRILLHCILMKINIWFFGVLFKLIEKLNLIFSLSSSLELSSNHFCFRSIDGVGRYFAVSIADASSFLLLPRLTSSFFSHLWDGMLYLVGNVAVEQIHNIFLNYLGIDGVVFSSNSVIYIIVRVLNESS